MQKNDVKTKKVLIDHEIRPTSLRSKLLSAFMSSKKPLAQSEVIQSTLSEMSKVDRVTVYRNIKLFLEKGLLHQASTNAYVYCRHNCDEPHGAHNHIILYCNSCSKHKELHSHASIKKFEKWFEAFSFFSPSEQISIQGTCLSCQENPTGP